MKIELKKLGLLNFKGIKDAVIPFHNETYILGANATGKSTVLDAFTWLLFGKDASDRKDFGIKTLEKGRPIEKLDHEVTGEFLIDGDPLIIKRVLREKWTKKRGWATAEFDGNETLYFWNEVPMSQSQWNDKIKENFGIEGRFRLLSNPRYFASLPWKDKREIISAMIPQSNDADIINSLDSDQEKILNTILSSKKSIEETKREIAAGKKKLSDELSQIPTRIDELKRNTPQSEDWDQLQKQIHEHTLSISEIDKTLTGHSQTFQEKNKSNQELEDQILTAEKAKSKLKSDVYLQIESDHSELFKKCSDSRRKTDSLKDTITAIESEARTLPGEIEKLNADLAKERENWTSINAEEIIFDAEKFCCPTCKRDFDESTIAVKKQELTDNYQQDKFKRLTASQTKGRALSEQLQLLSDKSNGQRDRLIQLQSEYDEAASQWHADTAAYNAFNKTAELEARLGSNPDYLIQSEKIDVLTQQLSSEPVIDHSDLLEQKNNLFAQIKDLQSRLNIKWQIESSEKRTTELQEQERAFANQLSDLEAREFAISTYLKVKIDRIEFSINQLFKNVQFKMFNRLINGSEEETCEILINGVPYSDANNAGQINAGLDIINTLSRFYQMGAPCFIDNAESVNQFISFHSQIIYLKVSNDKQLKYEYRTDQIATELAL